MFIFISFLYHLHFTLFCLGGWQDPPPWLKSRPGWKMPYEDHTTILKDTSFLPKQQEMTTSCNVFDQFRVPWRRRFDQNTKEMLCFHKGFGQFRAPLETSFGPKYQGIIIFYKGFEQFRVPWRRGCDHNMQQMLCFIWVLMDSGLPGDVVWTKVSRNGIVFTNGLSHFGPSF